MTETKGELAIKRLKQNKYEIEYQICKNDLDNDDLIVIQKIEDIEVIVRKNGKIVATADFTDNGIEFYCQYVKVEEGHRINGIASAMYAYAEKISEKILVNYWEINDPESQSMEAKKLWSSPNRPFGLPSSQ